MKLVYIAGPFSGTNRLRVSLNILNAEITGWLVASLGAYPVIPHANTAHPEFEKVQPYQFWIDGTLKQLSRCDAILMMPNWKESKGATAEHEYALANNIPVFYETEIEAFKTWLKASSQ